MTHKPSTTVFLIKMSVLIYVNTFLVCIALMCFASVVLSPVGVACYAIVTKSLGGTVNKHIKQKAAYRMHRYGY